MTTTTIQPCDIDSYIGSGAYENTNSGSETTLAVGKYIVAYLFRGILKFDHSSIPSAELCDSATISIYVDADASGEVTTMKVYRVLRNWTEAGVTWNKYDGTNTWATAGAMGAGDIDATELGTSGNISATQAAGDEIQIPLDTTEFKKMYDGTYTNYGFLLKITTENNNTAYYYGSRTYATTSRRPKLVIESHSSGGAVFIPKAIFF